MQHGQVKSRVIPMCEIGEAPQSDTPPRMNLSEEDSSVSCIAAQKRNRSIFFELFWGTKGEEELRHTSKIWLEPCPDAPIQVLGCRTPASPSYLGARVK
jgi:hypothetical protein